MNEKKTEASQQPFAGNRQMEKESIPDAVGLHLDLEVQREHRKEKILRELGDLKLFRVNNLEVRLVFRDGAPSLQDALSDFFMRQKTECDRSNFFTD